MKYKSVPIVIATLFLIGSNAFRAEASVTYDKTKMGNGLTVVLIENHASALVAIDIWVGAGSRNETPEFNGVSHSIEHLVFAGSSKYEAGELDVEMESVGATLNAHTSRDWARFSALASSRYTSKAIATLAEAVMNSSFREVNLQREKMVLMDEIARKGSDAVGVCEDILWSEVFSGHPYALSVEGSPAPIRNFTRQQLVDYHKKLYVPANMTVVVAGDFDAQDVVSAIGSAFQGISAGIVPERTVPKPLEKRIEKNVKIRSKLSYIGFGFQGPTGKDYADVCAVDVMLAHLGFGFRSWMAEDLVKRQGIASDVSADFLTHADPGLVSLIVTTDAVHIADVKSAIIARIGQIAASGLSDADMAMAKRSLLGQFAFQNETPGGVANTFGFYSVISDTDFGAKYPDLIQAVSSVDIARVAGKYLDLDRCAIVVLQGGDSGE